MTMLLRALGYYNEEMLDMFFEINMFHLGKKEGVAAGRSWPSACAARR